MKQKIYLDTSVLGALLDRTPEYRISSTKSLFHKIEAGEIVAVISDVALEELRAAPEMVQQQINSYLRGLSVVPETAESLRLARAYIEARAVPPKKATDARHIAAATVHGIQVIVSWNFRHMVNLDRKRRINSVNIIEGYPALDMISPLEVTHGRR